MLSLTASPLLKALKIVNEKIRRERIYLDGLRVLTSCSWRKVKKMVRAGVQMKRPLHE